MAKKVIRDGAYYLNRIDETEKRKKKVLEEEKKVKTEYREWKVNQIVFLMEKYSLIEEVTETTLWRFEEKLKELSKELNKKKTEENEKSNTGESNE
jgi:hypothetical protein